MSEFGELDPVPTERVHECAGGCGGTFPESVMVDEQRRYSKRWYCSACARKRAGNVPYPYCRRRWR